MFRILIAGVLGGVIVFICAAIFQMATPLGKMGIKEIPNEAELLQAMRNAVVEPGFYRFPKLDTSVPAAQQNDAWEKNIQAGPRGIMVIDPTPNTQPILPPSMFITEFISNVLASIVAAIVVACVGGGLMKRALIVAAMAIFAWLSISVSYWNWDRFPTEFTIAVLIMETVGALLSGFVIAAVVPGAVARNA